MPRCPVCGDVTANCAQTLLPAGERPYKCNICGNRFSTKGNLKVHFLCHNEKYPHIRMDQQQQQHQRQIGVAVPSQPPPLSVFQDAGSVSQTAAVASSRFLQSRPPLLVPITSGISGSGGNLLRPATSGASGTCFQSPSSSLKREYAAGTPSAATTPPPPLTSSSAAPAPDAIDFRRNADIPHTPDSEDHGRRVTPSFGGAGGPAAAPAFGSPRSFESRSPAANSGPTTMPPPPPLSLLSSMSTSLEAFSNPPPFSASFSGLYRPDSGNSQTLSSPPGPPAVHLPAPPPPPAHPFGFEPPPMYFGRSGTSLRNGKTDEYDPLEQFMEIQKSSETSKMEQLVRSIDKKLTDPNQCAVCLRTLSCKSALQMHYRTHTGERPFRCKICGRAFTTKGNLKTHMGVHRAKPPVRALHACRVCHKQFTNALVLQQHVRAHISSGNDDPAHRQLSLTQPQQLHLHQLQQQQPPPPGGMMMVQSSSAAAAAAAAAMTYMSPFAGYPFFPGAAAAAMAAARYGAPRHPLPQPDFAVGGLAAARYHGIERCRTVSPSSEDRGGGDGSSGREAMSSADDREVRAASVSMSEYDYRRHADYDDDDCDENLRDTAASDRDLNADDADNSVNDEDSNDAVDSPQNDAGSTAADNYSHAPPEDVSMTNNDDEADRRKSYDHSSAAAAAAAAAARYGDMLTEAARTSCVVPEAEKVMAEDCAADECLDRGRYLSYGDDFAVGSRYSTSLMALEEKVNEMNGKHDDDRKDMSSTSHPLEQMERIIQRTESAAPPTQPRVDCTDHVSSPSSTSTGLDCSIRQTIDSASTEQMAAAQRDLDGINLSPTAFEAATGRPNTTCSVCYKTFACRSALDIHYRSHTKERPFQCLLCHRSFSTKGNMKQHMLTHKSSGTGTVGLGADAAPSLHASDGSCSSSMSCPADDSNSNLISVEATGERSPTDDADREDPSTAVPSSATPTSAALASMSNQRLPDDTVAAAGGVPPPPPPPPARAASPSRRLPNLRHMCHVCQKPFSSASALQIHMRTHTGDKPFSCSVCGKAFTTKGNLKVHMGTHVWNSVPSRRGRRMSVDGLQPPGCHPAGANPALMRHHPARSPNLAPPPPSNFLAGAARLPTSGIYPFPFPFGSNGFGPGSAGAGMMASKLNEISVIQNRMMAPAAAAGPALPRPGAIADAMPRLPPGLSAIFSPQHAFAAAAAMRLPLPVSFQKSGPECVVGGGLPPDRRDIDNNNAPAGEKTGYSGELDLSLKKTQMPSACPRC